MRSKLKLVSMLVLSMPWFPTATHAADFYAIVTNFGNASKASAHLDVGLSADGGPVQVQFDVSNAQGALLAQFTVDTDARGIASSSAIASNDLFVLSGGAPALVRARTYQPAAAILHQSGPGNRLAYGVPPTRESDGTPYGIGNFFSVPVGDLPAPSLLIANVSGAEQTVDVFVGYEAPAGMGKYTTRLVDGGIWRVDILDEDKNANLMVTSTGFVVVQLVSDDGQHVSAVTCLPRQ